MSGRYMKLRPGRYVLSVPAGRGPAGVHRATGGEVAVDRHGGEVTFEVPSEERAYFWWRGSRVPAGLEVSGPGPMPRRRLRTAHREIAARGEPGQVAARRLMRASGEVAVRRKVDETGQVERGTQLAP